LADFSIKRRIRLETGDITQLHVDAIVNAADRNRVYGYPRKAAARVAVAAVCSHLAEQQWPELVAFVRFDTPTLDAYREALG
jgi:O-acetyl-ADP-ribose deacetylase (regulator of RNase III)